MRSPLLVLATVAVLGTGVSACGSSSRSASSGSGAGQTKTANPNGPEVNPAGDIPDNQAYVAYSPPASRFSVKVPEGWARTVRPGGVTSFTDKLNRVQMQQRAAASAPTLGVTQHSVIPTLAKTVPGFRGARVSTVSRTAGRAIRITYQATSPVDPVTGRSHTDAVERYEFFHRGTSVVLTLSGPKGADNVDPWKIVTDSLRYTR